ncbi:ATP-binding protein [Nocardioides sp. JQ2195]|uniref:ATP-binding protein n=1 Tax=Nocardioides sp. JQ2195 TaxID=2592334 RepID=UPI00143E6D08|nr:ATP-binding protein [Nocardioides sp. JQ2195]QIX26254.1 ATP-binding protein [Nocardioides sp. JQ2195]
MSTTVESDDRPEFRVRLAADTASVPGARRFVRDGLTTWRHTDLIDDAALCVTEMAANTALHSGSAFMNVVLRNLEQAVRVSVEDAGRLVPVQAVVPQTGGHPRTEHDRPVEELPITGRGLSIVSMLSRDWGIDETDLGRRIWAEIDATDTEHPIRPPSLGSTPVAELDMGALPAGWKLLRMPECPVDLGLQVDQHLDDLIRELQLIDAGSDDAGHTRELGELIQRLVSRPAFARHMGRRTAQDAAAAGLEFVDILMPAPRDLGGMVRELDETVALADRMCAEQHLLTLPSTPEMNDLRAWFTESMIGQLEDDSEPEPYADWLARQAGRQG